MNIFTSTNWIDIKNRHFY